MDHTFITIHNLGPEANILFASDSIYDILGYHPQQVLGRSSFDYFHPDEVPIARYIHERGVRLDKAAALHYARIRSANGQWIGCECCFTVVHDVLITCTSVYRRSQRSEQRALDAPSIRRLFSSPQDPRYHMLEHLAAKFKMNPPPKEREPRAALIINRFSRSLAVMFATDSITNILGLEPAQLQNKSFYELVGDDCLEDAEACLESAKANDSIAYLRFWSRDARREEDLGNASNGGNTRNASSSEVQDTGSINRSQSASTNDEEGVNARRNSSDSEAGGVRLDVPMDLDTPSQSASPVKRNPESQDRDGVSVATAEVPHRPDGGMAEASSSAGRAWNTGMNPVAATPEHSSGHGNMHRGGPEYPLPSVELEAVVSCTSDGLVVVLRRARAFPQNSAVAVSTEVPQPAAAGIFAAPWAYEPVRPRFGPEITQGRQHIPVYQHASAQHVAQGMSGPSMDQLMSSIRDVAVFAWALVGINKNLATHSHGTAVGNARPPDSAFSSEQAPDRNVYAPNGYSQDGAPYWPMLKVEPASDDTKYSSFLTSEKGVPVEPRYTLYPDDGARNVRQNGPWSNSSSSTLNDGSHFGASPGTQGSYQYFQGPHDFGQKP